VNGDRYEGSWSEGRRNGNGRLEFADGTEYNGDWKSDKSMCVYNAYICVYIRIHAYGYFFIDMCDYVLIYMILTYKHIVHGKGELKFPNGDVFRGDFVNGCRRSFGVYEYANGDVIEGRCEDVPEHGIVSICVCMYDNVLFY
jgi:hypothetical protein